MFRKASIFDDYMTWKKQKCTHVKNNFITVLNLCFLKVIDSVRWSKDEQSGL